MQTTHARPARIYLTGLQRLKPLHRPDCPVRLLSDQVGHLLTRQCDSTFKMVNIDSSISVLIFLFPSMSQLAVTNPPHLVNVTVAL